MKRSAYVLTILRPDGPRSRQVAVPRLVVAGLALLSLFGLSSFVTWAVSFGREAVELAELNRLRTQLHRSRQDNLALRETLAQVGQKVSSLELLAGEVQVLARLARNASQRVERPVPTKVYFNQLITPKTARNSMGVQSKAFQQLTGKIDRRIDNLAQLYTKGYWKLAYTPSIWPVQGILVDRFGVIEDRFGPGQSAFHQGIDISTRAGSLVVAPADGVVLAAERRSDYGKMIILRHRFGISTLYAHLSAYDVEPGEQVRRGQLIGFVGSTGRSTGPHLHYEVRVGGIPVNPIRYISKQARNRSPRSSGSSRQPQQSSLPL